jgi:hypothetical protein
MIWGAVAYAHELPNVIYNDHKCGLSYIARSIKVTYRDESMPNDPKGNPKPITFTINELPTSCFKIEKAFVWSILSDRAHREPYPYQFKVTNPKGKTKSYTAEFTGKGIGKGWSNDITINYRANFADIIDGNGQYVIDLDCEDYSCDGICIMIIYRDLKADYQGHLIINDGIITNNIDYENENIEFNLKGLEICASTSDAKAFILVSDLQTRLAYKTFLKARVKTNNEIHEINRAFWNFETFPTSLIQGQSSSIFGLSPMPNVDYSKYGDMYSIGLAGLYYKTNTCQVCNYDVPISISSSASNICPGESVKLSAKLPDDYLDQKLKYYWSSEPAGFVSNSSEITVAPTQETRYFIDVVIGDSCLKARNEYLIKINTPPKADAGPDLKLCGSETKTIGNAPTMGVPPYKYEWFPKEGLSDPYIMSPTVSASSKTQYSVKVVDAAGCVGYDTVNINLSQLAKPALRLDGDSNICKCASTTISVVDDFESYEWSSGQKTKSIKVDQPGKYYVYVTNKYGCSAYSDSIAINTFEPETLVSLNDTLVLARMGQIIEIPLKIKQIKKYLECGLSKFSAEIEFDKSILMPVDGTPFGEINNDLRTIGVQGVRNGLDSILYSFKFLALLGDSDFVKIKLKKFDWAECQGKVAILDSAVKIIDLCYQGGLRLFDATPTNNHLKQNSPNPFYDKSSIEFGVMESSNCEIVIIDMLGRVVKSYKYDKLEPGRYVLDIDAIDFPPGFYIYGLRTQVREVYKTMRVLGN